MPPKRLFTKGILTRGKAQFIGFGSIDGSSKVVWPGGAVTGDIGIISTLSNVNVIPSLTGSSNWKSWHDDSSPSIYPTIHWKKLVSGDLVASAITYTGTPTLTLVAVYRFAADTIMRYAKYMSSSVDFSVSLTPRPQSVGIIHIVYDYENNPPGADTPPAGFTDRGGITNSLYRIKIGDQITGKWTGGTDSWTNMTGAAGGGAQYVFVLEMIGPQQAGTVESSQSEPQLTDNSTPSGHFAWDRDYKLGATPSGTAYRAFDGNNLDGEPAPDGQVTPSQQIIWGRAFPYSRILGRYGLRFFTTQSCPITWTVEGLPITQGFSDPTSVWEILDSQNLPDGGFVANTTRYFDVPRANWLSLRAFQIRIFRVGSPGSAPYIFDFEFRIGTP